MRAAGWIGITLLFLGLGLWDVGEAGPPAPASHLTILYTGAISGELEPCGCTTGPLGGFAHRGPILADIRASGVPTLSLDAGNLLLKEVLVAGEETRDSLPRARLLVDLIESQGAQAWAIGPQDVQAVGVDGVKGLLAGRALKGLSVNLLDEAGRAAFPASAIFEVGGRRIGVIGVTGQGDDLLGVGASIRTRPGPDAAAREAASLRPRVDLIVVLSTLDAMANEALAAAAPEVDFILSGPADNPIDSGAGIYDPDGEPPFIVPLGPQGRFVGRLDLILGPGAPVARPQAAPELGASLRTELVAQEELAALKARILEEEGAPNPARFEALGALKRSQIADARAVMAAPRARPGFYYQPIPVTPGGLEDQAAIRAIEAFKAQEVVRVARAAKQSAPIVSFAGDTSCRGCHPLQYAQWRGTEHSRAFETLKGLGRQGDPTCIGCHSTGFKQPGGFFLPSEVAGHEGVGCEACHGPMSDHPERRRFVTPTSVGTCVSCHDAANDPDFDYDASRPSITCPAGVTSPGGLVGETHPGELRGPAPSP